jgi:hypothetical protein
MTVNREMRASDQDREHVVETLRTHYTEGRLNLEEFDERVARAYESKTLGELLDLTTDLPGEVSLGPVKAPAEPERETGLSRLPRGLLPLAAALGALVLVSSIAWSGIANQGHHHYVVVFPWPLLLILFFFLRRGGRSYRNGR